VPQQYIPVGQGFTVWAGNDDGNADIEGGQILFKNSQRFFEIEGDNSVFIRPAAITDIRLGFDTPQNYHGQILLGVRANTSSGFDLGWDAPSFNDTYPGADVRWVFDDNEFVIQAVPEINLDSSFPLNVLVSEDGIVNFVIDQATNLPEDISEIYVYDTFNDTYNQVNDGHNFELYLTADTYNDRFVLVFKNPETLSNNQIPLENIVSYVDQQTKELVILNKKQQNIDMLKLYALTGQEVLSRNDLNNDIEIRIPLQLPTGIYLLKIKSDEDKVYTSKLIVK